MNGKELKEIVNKLNDKDEVIFYIWDYEYDDESPSEQGIGKFIDISKSNYSNKSFINIGLNKNN